jgi:hypothetical protein
MKVADSSLKTIGALGEHTSKAAGMVAAGVTTAVGQTQHTVCDAAEGPEGVQGIGHGGSCRLHSRSSVCLLSCKVVSVLHGCCCS